MGSKTERRFRPKEHERCGDQIRVFDYDGGCY
jgi:hypothetical protein